MSKVLITGGCSFTESKYADCPGVTQSWAYQLGMALKNQGYDFVNKAMGSQGNGLISRGVLYQITEELKTRKPEDLLVGVMWSGVHRHDYRVENPELQNFIIEGVYNGWMENPTGFINTDEKKWIILNQHWVNENEKNLINHEAKLYYKHFHDFIGSYIYSIEHMLRLQYFLKCKGIKYFFTIYQDHVFDPYYLKHVEVDYLYKLLDKTQFLPVTSQYTWCVESRIDEQHWVYPHPNNHPSTIHHQAFTQQIVLPWLKSRNYI